VAILPISLLLVGSGAFSGILFYEKITSDRTFSGYVRYGGTATIFGWMTMILL